MSAAAELVVTLLEGGMDPKELLMGHTFSGQEIYDDGRVAIAIPYSYTTLQDLLQGGFKPISRDNFEKVTQETELLAVVDKATRRGLLYQLPSQDDLRLQEWSGNHPYEPTYGDISHDQRAIIIKYFDGQISQGINRTLNMHRMLSFDGFGAATQKHGRLLAGMARRDLLTSHEMMRLAVSYRRQGRKLPGFLRSQLADTSEERHGKDGVTLFYKDFDALTDLFPQNKRDTAEKVFSGDMYDLFYFTADDTARDLVDHLDDERFLELKNKLIGYTLDDDTEEFPEGLITAEGIEDMSEREVGSLIDDNSTLVDFKHALQNSDEDAWRSGYEAVYWKKYVEAVTDALGPYTWVKVGGKDVLSFTIPYSKITELMTKYEENEGEPYAGSMHDLVQSTVEFDSPGDDLTGHADFDKSYFNETFSDVHLPEVPDAEVKEDEPEGQQSLALGDIPRTDPRGNIENVYRIFSDEYPKGASVRMKRRDYEKFAREYPHRVDARKWAEYAARRKGEVPEAPDAPDEEQDDEMKRPHERP